MHSRALFIATLSAVVLLPAAASANGFAFASLQGFNEDPSVVTDASGNFTAVRVGDEIHFSLRYKNIASFVAQAHIHIGQPHTNGGVSLFLCNSTPTGPQPRPCAQGSGAVEGTITSADVIGPAGQGVQPGDLDAVIKAMKAGATYVNVHSADFPTGEIRGQVRALGF